MLNVLNFHWLHLSHLSVQNLHLCSNPIGPPPPFWPTKRFFWEIHRVQNRETFLTPKNFEKKGTKILGFWGNIQEKCLGQKKGVSKIYSIKIESQLLSGAYLSLQSFFCDKQRFKVKWASFLQNILSLWSKLHHDRSTQKQYENL